jgi:hypothetical protein
MKRASILAALALALGATAAAQATTTSLGTLGDGDLGFSAGGTGPGGAISDVVTFSLSAASSITDAFLAGGISPIKVSLYTASNTLIGSFSNAMAPINFGGKSFSSLSKGDYEFLISGTGSSKGGSYFNVFSVSAVPEADTWVMLVIGAGLIGFQLRRKHQSLPPRAITGS